MRGLTNTLYYYYYYYKLFLLFVFLLRFQDGTVFCPQDALMSEAEGTILFCFVHCSELLVSSFGDQTQNP